MRPQSTMQKHDPGASTVISTTQTKASRTCWLTSHVAHQCSCSHATAKAAHARLRVPDEMHIYTTSPCGDMVKLVRHQERAHHPCCTKYMRKNAQAGTVIATKTFITCVDMVMLTRHAQHEPEGANRTTMVTKNQPPLCQNIKGKGRCVHSAKNEKCRNTQAACKSSMAQPPY